MHIEEAYHAVELAEALEVLTDTLTRMRSAKKFKVTYINLTPGVGDGKGTDWETHFDGQEQTLTPLILDFLSDLVDEQRLKLAKTLHKLGIDVADEDLSNRVKSEEAERPHVEGNLHVTNSTRNAEEI